MDEPVNPSTTPPARDPDGAPRADADPEFGPSGYLPARAAQRARKIVLRSPLGLQWVVASLVAGLVVVVAGVWLLVASGGPPGEPWVRAIEVDALGDTAVDPDLDVLLVGAGGRVRAFADAPDVGYCPDSHRLEAPDGRVWTLTGRGLDGTDSLEEHPTLVQDGVVYVDPSRTRPGPEPSAEPAEPAC